MTSQGRIETIAGDVVSFPSSMRKLAFSLMIALGVGLGTQPARAFTCPPDADNCYCSTSNNKWAIVRRNNDKAYATVEYAGKCGTTQNPSSALPKTSQSQGRAATPKLNYQGKYYNRNDVLCPGGKC